MVAELCITSTPALIAVFVSILSGHQIPLSPLTPSLVMIALLVLSACQITTPHSRECREGESVCSALKMQNSSHAGQYVWCKSWGQRRTVGPGRPPIIQSLILIV